jgi:acyl carrier protein
MIAPRLKKAILGALELDDWDLREDTVASQVPGWGSLSHAMVIAAVEAEYRIRLLTSDILRLRTVGGLQTLVNEKGRT